MASIILLIQTYINHHNSWISTTCFCISFFCIAILIGSVKTDVNKLNYFFNQKQNNYLVKIIEQPIEKNNSIQLKVNVEQNNVKRTVGKALLYLEKDKKSTKLNYGDILSIRNTFKPITANKNPFEFDYRRYLKIHNIYHQGYLTSLQWTVVSNHKENWYSAILSVRKTLDGWISTSSLSIQNQKVAKALLLGEKELLDPDTLKSFSSAGAMHVLAVSGLHVGIIMLILQFLLKPVKKIKYGHFAYTFAIISGVWFYAIITGFSPSVMRAALMFSFIIFGQGLQRQNSIYQSILVSALIILLFDPYSLFKVGFQLSYLAVLGIVFFQPKIYNAFYLKNKVLDYVWKISSVSIAAQLATFPLGLYYFHQFPNLFLISNIIVIPLAGFLLSMGFLYFALYFLSPVKIVLEYTLDILFTVLNKSMAAIEAIPHSLILGISINWIEVFIIYALILSLTIGFIKKSKVLIYAFLMISIAFLFIQWDEKLSTNNQKKMTCYNIKNDFAADFFEGSNNSFLCTNKLLNNRSKLLFHIKHHWFKNKGNQLPDQILHIDNLVNPVFNLSNDTKLSIINSNNVKLPVSNFIILYQISFISENVLAAWKQNNTVLIIHPDLSKRVCNFVEHNYHSDLIYDMKTKGAFQLNYK
ncbi:MAG: ComEC/Rec2 family competence protein [Crocinitomicaceae bacterium]